MTHRERVIAALNHEEPDRVPHFEWVIDSRVRKAICPDCTDANDFAMRMGHDSVLVSPDYQRVPVGPNRVRSEWGHIVQTGAEEHGIEVESPIHSREDFDKYSPPDPLAPGRFASLDQAVRQYKAEYAIGVHLNDVFSIPRCLMGMSDLLMAVVADPELVRWLVKMSVDLNAELARESARRGADFVWTGDDYAYNTGPLMSPAHFRELFFPELCRAVRSFHDAGLPVIKHTDGNIWPIIDMIIDAGIDCLDPIDPQAGMDLGEVKARYGDRVALKGNVDCAQTMTFGTPEEVAAETKEALRKGAPGGGFILSSSNSIHSTVKPENYLAMLDTLRAHGRYPIAL